MGEESFLRPEVGFTPKWFREALGIDFGERWHREPASRREAIRAMRGELIRRFSDTDIGHVDEPLDLLTGTYGACVVAGIYGVPLVYAADNWPNCEHRYLSDAEADSLTPPDLDANPFLQELLDQATWIAESEGVLRGFVNWQGVLNNAQRLRGPELFVDMMTAPERCRRIFDCVATTMIDAAQRLQARQRASGFEVGFFTVSNCLVNMVAPAQYRDLLLPHDRRIAEAFGCIGVHNCAWNADPYVDTYAALPNVAYIDMGMDSDLARARAALPHARRAVMYTPMDVANKPLDTIHADFERIARDYGPCDIVLADIEAGTPDERVLDVLRLCEEICAAYS